MKGHVTVAGDNRLLFTSIPYVEGWTVFVNGKKTESFALMNGAFIGIKLPGSGEFEIEMKYSCPWLKEGMIAGAIGVFLLTGIIILENNKKKARIMIKKL